MQTRFVAALSLAMRLVDRRNIAINSRRVNARPKNGKRKQGGEQNRAWLQGVTLSTNAISAAARPLHRYIDIRRKTANAISG